MIFNLQEGLSLTNRGLCLPSLLVYHYQQGSIPFQCGWFWRGFLHHTYRVLFHPMLDRTSLLKSKNRSTQGAVKSE